MSRTTLILLLALAPLTANACFLVGESTDGLNKICYYDCASGRTAITVSAITLCPLSLYREMRQMMSLPAKHENLCTAAAPAQEQDQ